MLASSCVTMTNVTPRLSASRRISASSSADVIGSRPADGSSRNRICGSSAIARAIAARFCMPPEISFGRCPVNCTRPTRSSFMRASSSICSPSSCVNASSGRRTFSSSVIEPNSAPDWYMTPNLRRIASRASPSAVTMSSPSISTWPFERPGRGRSCASAACSCRSPSRRGSRTPRRAARRTRCSRGSCGRSYPAVTPSTRMIGSPASIRCPARSRGRRTRRRR